MTKFSLFYALKEGKYCAQDDCFGRPICDEFICSFASDYISASKIAESFNQNEDNRAVILHDIEDNSYIIYTC